MFYFVDMKRLLSHCKLCLPIFSDKPAGRTENTHQFLDHSNKDSRESEMELPMFDLTTIANATNNFSNNNKLGEGGFGPVYKVTLQHANKFCATKLHRKKRLMFE